MFYFDSVENANVWVVLYWPSKIWASAIKNEYRSNTTFKIVMVGIPINVEEFCHLIGVKEKNRVFWLVVHCYFTKADIQQFVNIGIRQIRFLFGCHIVSGIILTVLIMSAAKCLYTIRHLRYRHPPTKIHISQTIADANSDEGNIINLLQLVNCCW